MKVSQKCVEECYKKWLLFNQVEVNTKDVKTIKYNMYIMCVICYVYGCKV